MVSGGSRELLERITQEVSMPHADVMFGGGVETLEAYRSCFQPYACAKADAIDPAFREAEDWWTPFSALPVVLICNHRLVSLELLGSWADLARPEFRGRIAYADPMVSGSAFTSLVTLLYAGKAADMTAFVKNLDGRLQASSGAVPGAVASGECLVGITLEDTALKYIAAGDTITLTYPADGTSCVPDGTAILADAPHPDNARAFLDFVLGDDVQQLLSQSFHRRSVRTDITDIGMVPLEELHLLPYDPQWVSANREDILAIWQSSLKEAAES